jgi:hypothetical protein
MYEMACKSDYSLKYVAEILGADASIPVLTDYYHLLTDNNVPAEAMSEAFGVAADNAELLTATLNFAVVVAEYDSHIHPNIKKLKLNNALDEQ